MKPRTASWSAIALAMLAGVLAACGGRAGRPDGGNFAGNESCAACHEQESRYCRYGPHRTLSCERCHGPGRRHARAGQGSRPAMRLGGVDLCLSCHQRGNPSSGVASRIISFEDHLEAIEREHRITLDRQKSESGCVYCHDPHLLE